MYKKFPNLISICLFFICNFSNSQDLVDITNGMDPSKTQRPIGISDNEGGIGDGRGWSTNLYLPGNMLSGSTPSNKDNTLTSIRFMIDKAGTNEPIGDIVYKDVKIYLFN